MVIIDKIYRLSDEFVNPYLKMLDQNSCIVESAVKHLAEFALLAKGNLIF